MGCYIWYRAEGLGRAAVPPSPLLAVPNVTAHPSTANVPMNVLLYDGPLLCGFIVAIKGLRNAAAGLCAMRMSVRLSVRLSVCRLKCCSNGAAAAVAAERLLPRVSHMFPTQKLTREKHSRGGREAATPLVSHVFFPVNNPPPVNLCFRRGITGLVIPNFLSATKKARSYR